ncbi:MAG: hypothetical protein QN121_12550 [Armatimonadota bacterium]|nr:hypothetical protein [Armatimonadota bacterium]
MSLQANQTIANLDIRCAELGRELANVQNMDEKVLNEALAVLEEQGPYAMFLYVRARHERVANAFEEHCVRFLREVFVSKIRNNASALDAMKQLADDPNDLLFVRDLLRNVLGYARYHLKAKGS